VVRDWCKGEVQEGKTSVGCLRGKRVRRVALGLGEVTLVTPLNGGKKGGGSREKKEEEKDSPQNHPSLLDKVDLGWKGE